MTLMMVTVLTAAAWLVARPGARSRQRIHKALPAPQHWEPDRVGGLFPNESLPWHRGGRLRLLKRNTFPPLSLTVLVQQTSALLRGGRSRSRLWEELWLVHGGKTAQAPGPDVSPAAGRPIHTGPQLSAGSLEVLLAARAATRLGSSAANAIRTSAEHALPGAGNKERRIWGELAACFDVSETSGCPLADVLNRFAAHLEAEDDADAARRTALAGPKATVRLLGWLPLLGLGLGMVLGVDPLGVLLGSPFGVAALLTGLLLTLAGKIWSVRLVQAAAGPT